ncbi:MAG: hypothetical protein FIB01_07675 [Gemmatimonadetes bacterium]|nr:hypothetical protein [Gemmatimonadota bacterium]
MSTTDAPAEPKASRWEDYVDVFFSPVELFARRANDSVKPAFWTLVVLGAIAYYAFLPINQMVMRAAMVAAAQARGTDAAAVEAAAGGIVRIMSYAGGIMVALSFAFTIAAAALLLVLIGRMIEVKGSFRQAFLIATFAAFVALLAQVAASVNAMIVGEGLNPLRDLSFGPLRFLDYEALPKALPPLLRRFEIFAIWQAVLWGIGTHVVLKATKAQAAIAAIGTSLLFALPGVISAAFGFGQQAARCPAGAGGGAAAARPDISAERPR